MRYSGPSESTETQAYRRAKLGVYYFDRHVGSGWRMFDLRILNLIAFGMIALAFVIVAAKLDKSRELNRQLETKIKDQMVVERAYAEAVKAAKEHLLTKGE